MVKGALKMEPKCHDLTTSTLVDGKPFDEEWETADAALARIKEAVPAGTLVSLGAVYGDEEWALDVSCEGGLSTAVILEIGTGATYTYLNPRFSARFDRLNSLPNVFICEDMDAFSEDEENQEALAEVEINGADCPALHVCEDRGILLELITHFLNTGTIYPGADWLRS